MKIFLASLMIFLSINMAYADGRHHDWGESHYRGWGESHYRGWGESHYRGWGEDHHRGWGHDGGDRWIVPALIGGFIGYQLASPRTVYVQPAPRTIVVEPQISYADPAQPVYEERLEFDSSCNCYVKVYHQIGWR